MHLTRLMKPLMLCASSYAVLGLADSTELRAQETQIVLEEITVTSRKREESLLDIPISISAYSAADLQQFDITDLTDLAISTPGLNFEQNAFTTGFRFLPQIRFRGMVAVNPRPNNRVGAVFVDGAFVADGGTSLATDDVERIEVIKGPQSVYFGRNVFGGAINFITKVPGDEPTATFSSKYESRDTYEIGGSIEGPLIEGRLSGRLMAKSFQQGAHYKSLDGGDVGRQKSNMITGALSWTPTEDFSLRVRAHYQEDDDYGNLLLNLSGNNATCQPGSRPFFCGKLPSIGDTITTINGSSFTVTEDLVSQDTSLTPIGLVENGTPNALIDFLGNVGGALNEIDFLDKVPSIDHFGSTREVTRVSGVWDWDLDKGFTLSGIFGYGSSATMALRDDDNTLGNARAASISRYTLFPFLAEDLSAEVRLTSPQDERFRYLAGVSYYKQKLDGNLSGSGHSLSSTGSITPFINNDRDRSYAWGAFGSVSYDITDQLTVDLEGRYQEDKSRQFVETGVGQFDPVNNTFADFLPRAILTYKPTEESTVYGSWSKGALTGIANTGFNNIVNQVVNTPNNPLGSNDPAEVLAILSNLLDASEIPETVPAEKIDHYEIGWKQSFLDGRARTSLAGYYIKWKNMKQTTFVFTDVTGNGAQFVSALFPGKSRNWGVEFDFDLQATDSLWIGLSGEYVDAQFTDFTIRGSAAEVASQSSAIDANGLTPILYPEYTVVPRVRYSQPINNDMNWYAGAEATWTGKTWANEANTTYVGAYIKVDARLGVEGDGWRVELYGRNLTDYDGPASARRNTLGDGSTGISIQPSLKRTFGVRTNFTF